ncbi:MAG TPA: MFS transporter [Anaerolineae bacterium]|nr:MFS transporter [Anaerolineae bacterium]
MSLTSAAYQETKAYPDYRRNFAAGWIHGVFFQMSATFGNIQTVLPAFVTFLTLSTAVIGLMATIQGIGEIIPQLFTAHLIDGKPRKKHYLLGIITWRWIAWALLAWLTFQYGVTHPGLVLTVLIILFGSFSLAGGMGSVIYADIFSRAIPAQRRGRFVSARQIGGFALAILAGWIVKNILDAEDVFPFPVNFSLIFALSAATLAVAFVGFALIREPVSHAARQNHSVKEMLRQGTRLVRDNANLRLFLISRAVIGMTVGMASFYVVYARNDLGVSAGAVGLFLTAQMAGAAVSNILWGWLADGYGNKTVIVGTMATAGLTAVFALTLPALYLPAYVVVFILLGAMLSGWRIGYNNFVLEMAPEKIRAACVAWQNTLIAPVTLLPLIAGALLSSISFTTIFVIELGLIAIGLIASLRLKDPRHTPEGICT